MVEIRIRKITGEEVDQLQQISRQTFYDTFASVNTAENMHKFLEKNYSREKLSAELSDRNTEVFFAEDQGEVIGYLKINYGQAQTELKDEKSLEIERIYVLKEYLGKKVGQLLFEYALRIATERNADYIWLGVWEENQRAIRFYEKNGFVVFDKHLFKLGDDEQTDLLMRLSLNLHG